MGGLLAVLLLLIEIPLVMKLEPQTYACKSKTLGLSAASMFVAGYYD